MSQRIRANGVRWMRYLAFIAIAAPGFAAAQGFPTTCPATYYIAERFQVPSDDGTGDKLFDFGTGNFGLTNVNLTKGIYTRTSAGRDYTGQYTWLRGAIGVTCTRTYEPFGTTIWIVWDGRLWGTASSIHRGGGGLSCDNATENDYYDDPYEDNSPEDACIGGGSGGDGGGGGSWSPTDTPTIVCTGNIKVVVTWNGDGSTSTLYDVSDAVCEWE